jgi:hypothetical protein
MVYDRRTCLVGVLQGTSGGDMICMISCGCLRVILYVARVVAVAGVVTEGHELVGMRV